MKRFNVFAVMLVLILLAGFMLPAEGQTEFRRITITTGPLQGSWTPVAGYIANKWMDENKNIQVTVINGGALGNLKVVNKGKDAQIAICTYAPLYFGARDKVEGLQNVAISNVRGVCAFMSSYVSFIVKADSNIQSIADLKDKRILPGKKNFGPELIVRQILKTYNMDYKKIKKNGGNVSFVGYPEMVRLIKDGHADCAVFGGHVPHPTAQQMETYFPLRVLQIEKNVLAKMKQQYPYLKTHVHPAGIYKGQKQSVELLDNVGIMIAHKDVPDDIVYNFLTVLYKEQKKITENWKYVNLLSHENGLAGLTADMLHPGAAKYWRKIGKIK